jgi:hypothetical protein
MNDVDFGLKSKALIASLNIGTWSGRKYDKKATNIVMENVNATGDCGRFNKLLVEHEAILKVYRIAAKARIFHYTHSLPWTDEGSRLLPTKAYTMYVNGINEHIQIFWAAVDEFCQIYDSLVDIAKARLADLWNSDDYPTVDQIRGKFHMNISFSFLPDPKTDFRLNLSDVEVDKVRASMAQAVLDTEKTAQRELWLRMNRVVARIVDRLGDPDKVFKKTTFENIDELERHVEILNVTEDQDIENTMKKIRDELTQYDPDEIRKHTNVRKIVHDRAKGILDTISSFV